MVAISRDNSKSKDFPTHQTLLTCSLIGINSTSYSDCTSISSISVSISSLARLVVEDFRKQGYTDQVFLVQGWYRSDQSIGLVCHENEISISILSALMHLLYLCIQILTCVCVCVFLFFSLSCVFFCVGFGPHGLLHCGRACGGVK